MAKAAVDLHELLNTFKVEGDETKYIDSSTENNDNLELEQNKLEQQIKIQIYTAKQLIHFHHYHYHHL